VLTSLLPGEYPAQKPQLKVKVKVTLRLAAYSQSFHLGVKPLETHDKKIFN
jgi:hypothetical protein